MFPSKPTICLGQTEQMPQGTQLCVSNVRAAVDLQFVVFQVALDVKELSTSPKKTYRVRATENSGNFQRGPAREHPQTPLKQGDLAQDP